MSVVSLVTLVWLLHIWRLVHVIRRGGNALSRTLGFANAFGVTGALAAIALTEFARARGLAWIWLELALTGGVLAVLVAIYLRAFRAQRFALSFWADFAALCCAVAALVSVLMILAVRLHDLAPFGALMVGVLSFFLPIYAVAEVLNAGRESQHRRSGRRSKSAAS